MAPPWLYDAPFVAAVSVRAPAVSWTPRSWPYRSAWQSTFSVSMPSVALVGSSVALQTNLFQAVDTHEPVSPPGNRMYCSIMLGPFRPVTISGLNSVSGQMTFAMRLWLKARQRPLDKIDMELLAAATTLIGALSSQFTLKGTVRNINLLAMAATPAWVEMEGEQFRVIEVAVPVVINDMFTQEA